MQIKMKLASESHVPRFRAGVGTWRSGYMIPIRLPWRHRARPSATLHEILSAPKGKLVSTMLHGRVGGVKSELTRAVRSNERLQTIVIPTRERSETGGICCLREGPQTRPIISTLAGSNPLPARETPLGCHTQFFKRIMKT
jgi:hypothetical protein